MSIQQIKRIDNQEGKKLNREEAIPKDSGYWIYAIIGARGRGKSTILLNLLNEHLKKYYDNIYLFSTTADMDPKFEKLIEELDEEDKFIPTFSEEKLEQVLNIIKDYNSQHNNPRNLIVFDDCISLFPKSTDKSSIFNKFIVGSRHYKTDCILTSQQFRKLNTLIRSNLDIISLFPTVNKKELNAYSEELNIEKVPFEMALDKIQEDKHKFLTINFMHGKPIMYINFEII